MVAPSFNPLLSQNILNLCRNPILEMGFIESNTRALIWIGNIYTDLVTCLATWSQKAKAIHLRYKY